MRFLTRMRHFFLLVLFAVPIILFGQHFGIRAGLGTGTLYTVDNGFDGFLPDYKYSLSYSVDFNWWGKLSDKVFLVPGLGLSGVSTTYKNPLDIQGQEQKDQRLSLLYLKSPIRMYFLFNKFMPHIGPSFGYQLYRNQKNRGNDYVYYPHNYDRKFDYGIDIGVGLKFTENIVAGINFYNGFGNIEKIECGNCASSQEEVSGVRTFELYLSYLLTK